MNAFRTLRAHDIDPDVLCTVNSITTKTPLEVYRYFLDQGVTWLQFIPIVERGPDGGPTQTTVGPEDFGKFLCKIFDEWVRHDVGRVGVQNFLEPLLVLMGRPPNLCVIAETCGLALALEHDGSVYSCDHFVDTGHRLGDVRHDGLARLVGSARQLAFGKAKQGDLPERCRACPVLALCNGGCPKQRLVRPNHSQEEAGQNYLCPGYRAFYTHALPYLRRMALIARLGQPLSAVMAELEREEREERQLWRETGRNELCPCGSGKKFKLCCSGKLRR